MRHSPLIDLGNHCLIAPGIAASGTADATADATTDVATDGAADVAAGPALVAVAHGSRDPRAAATVEELLAAVRARRPGLRVMTSYLDHAAPTPVQALGALAADGAGDGAVDGAGDGAVDGAVDGAGAGHGAGRGDRDAGDAVVLPLLLTAAYHSKTDIPRVLTDVRSRHPRLGLRYGDPLGPHPLLIDALERRLDAAGTAIGDPDTAVVLVAAGSSDPGANGVIARLARGWRRRGWYDVVPAYASAASPCPGDAVRALRAAGAPRVAVASYFLAPGYFADKVRDESLRAGADVVSPVLGAAPELAGLVLRRYDEALLDVRAAAVG
jgi:sirohydrochlorin ferrochelatase